MHHRLIAAAFVLLLLIGCGETPSATDSALKRRHFRPTISALVPANWEAVKDIGGRTTHFKSPREGEDDSFHENIGMSVKMMLNGDNLDEIWKDYQSRAVRPGMEKVDEEQLTLAGMKAKFGLFDRADNGRSYAVWLAESTPTEHVVFVAVMETKDSERFMPLFHKIVAGVNLHLDAPR